MAAASTIPFTAIENSSIARASHIGLAALGALVVIKSHLNQKTGQCNPSYNTLANEAGVDRSTMIRYVKRLKAVNLIDPRLRFRDDGGYAANQYHFAVADKQATPTTPEAVATAAEADRGNGAEPPPLVAEMPPPGGAATTTPSGKIATSLKNKTEERTSDPLLCLPTEKQKTCLHPQEEIAQLSENIIICNHCFALLDDNPTLATITIPRSPDRALPECEGLPEPEAMQPPVGNISTQKPVRSNGEKNNAKNFGTTASETPLRMAWKSPQIGSREEKTAKKTNPLVFIGKLLTGHLKSF